MERDRTELVLKVVIPEIVIKVSDIVMVDRRVTKSVGIHPECEGGIEIRYRGSPICRITRLAE